MKRLLLCFYVSLITFSCTESDSTVIQESQLEPNFYALTVGNSWVYKNYKYNRDTESYDETGVIDSIQIVGTQDFSGELYFKFRRFTTGNEEGITLCNPNGEHFEFLREDNGNLVNEEGAIKFTNRNYEERLINENNWGNIYEILVEGNTDINVEAGDFNCIHSERYAKNLDGEQYPGLDRFYYADGVGLVYDTSSFVSNPIPLIVRRLDSYILQ